MDVCPPLCHTRSCCLWFRSHAAELGARLADLHLENQKLGEALRKGAGTVGTGFCGPAGVGGVMPQPREGLTCVDAEGKSISPETSRSGAVNTVNATVRWRHTRIRKPGTVSRSPNPVMWFPLHLTAWKHVCQGCPGFLHGTLPRQMGHGAQDGTLTSSLLRASCDVSSASGFQYFHPMTSDNPRAANVVTLLSRVADTRNRWPRICCAGFWSLCCDMPALDGQVPPDPSPVRTLCKDQVLLVNPSCPFKPQAAQFRICSAFGELPAGDHDKA